MKNKSLMNLSLAATASLAAAMSFIVIANNHENVNLVRSQNGETTIIINGSNIVRNYCYASYQSGITYQRSFWQLRNPGNYVMMSNNSYVGGAFGGDHVYTNEVTDEGKGYAVNIELTKTGTYQYYFDQEKQNEIYRPSVSNLSKIEITLGEGHNVPFYNKYGIYHVVEEEENNKLIITLNENKQWSNDFYPFSISGEDSVAGKKIVIDEIALTYSCDDMAV